MSARQRKINEKNGRRLRRLVNDVAKLVRAAVPSFEWSVEAVDFECALQVSFLTPEGARTGIAYGGRRPHHRIRWKHEDAARLAGQVARLAGEWRMRHQAGEGA